MRLLKLHLIRPDADAEDDDVISFRNIPELPDMVKITVEYAATGTTENTGFSNSFVLPRAGAYDYAMTVIGSLVKDDDPFEKLQISSAMFPSVIYRVENLDEWEVRTAVQDIVYSTFNTTIS